jgi:3-hydroxyisobutyrate dehydrogenase
VTALPRVGFVGLGAMGGALARRLVARTALTVYDIDRARVEGLVVAGASAADSPAAVGDGAEVVLTCLPTSQDVRSLLVDDGLIDHLLPGSLFVDCTSGDPVVTRELAVTLGERGVGLVDAAVSGGPQAADAGMIAILTGGEELSLDRAESVLRLISPNVRRMGPVGSGHCVKLLNNMLAAAHRLLAFETTAVAAAHGISPRGFIDAVNLSSGRSYATEVTMPRHIFGEQLRQGFSLGLMAKDVRLARTLLTPELEAVSATAAVVDRLGAVLYRFGPAADINCLIEIYEDAIGSAIATSSRADSRG